MLNNIHIKQCFTIHIFSPLRYKNILDDYTQVKCINYYKIIPNYFVKWNVCMEERCFAQQRTRIRRMTADVPSSAARCGARRFTLWWSKSRQHGGPPKSTLAPVRGTIPAWPAGCSPSAKRSMQVNATRPDAQRLQSATCRKQPGARRCRRAAGGRCITICSFFPSYSRPSFSPPSLSRDHRSCTYVRATERAVFGLAMAPQPIFTRNFQASRPRVPVPRRGHVNIAAGPARKFRQTENRSGTEQRNGYQTAWDP